MSIRKYGPEAKYGIGGGGIVSEESQRNLDVAEELCQLGRQNEAAPFLAIALKDPNNFDAEIQLTYLCPEPLAIGVLESAERKARAFLLNHLGVDCFDDGGPYVGRFCDAKLLPTRPYMRVLQALVRTSFEAKQYEQGVRTAIEMLRLCPADHLRQRWWLAPMLIRTRRFADALFFSQLQMQNTDEDGEPLVALPRGGTIFKAPSDKLLSPEIEERYATTAPCTMAYTAALAAFKLWGRALQVTQLLRIAARTNPSILAKIIGRQTQPTEPKHGPGDHNGPNEAHDYLWVAQDLWMVPDVWDWVNEDSADAVAGTLKSCSRPGCHTKEVGATQFKRCAACRLVVYCGHDCQKEDWKRHKPECTKEAERRRFMKNA